MGKLSSSRYNELSMRKLVLVPGVLSGIPCNPWLRRLSLEHFCCSVAQSCQTLCNPVDFSTPGFPPPYHLPEFAIAKFLSIESMTPSNHVMLCRPLLVLPSIFPSVRSFPMNWLFASGSQSIGASPSTSVLLVSIQG